MNIKNIKPIVVWYKLTNWASAKKWSNELIENNIFLDEAVTLCMSVLKDSFSKKDKNIIEKKIRKYIKPHFPENVDNHKKIVGLEKMKIDEYLKPKWRNFKKS